MGKIKMKGKRQIILLFNMFMYPVELLLRSLIHKKIKHECLPVIFIVGSPRCGSTLLLQVLINRYQLAFVNNLKNFMYRIPQTADLIERFILNRGAPRVTASFKSNYGSIEGVFAPSEAGGFWAQWFPRKKIIPGLDHSWLDFINSPRSKLKLPQEIELISLLSKSPFISKNLYNSLRITELNKLFPNAVFVVMTRNLEDIAVSILEGREKVLGDKSKWFSVQPSISNSLAGSDSGYCTEVVEQPVEIYRQISKQLESIDTNRIIRVDYLTLCKDPAFVTREFESLLLRFGVTLCISGDLPESFIPSNGYCLDVDKKEIQTAVLRARQDNRSNMEFVEF